MKKFILSIVILICFILVNLFKFNTTYFLIAIFVIELIRLLIRKFKVKLDYFIIILFISVFNALILNLSTAISLLLIYDFLDQILEILDKSLHKYLKNYVKNDYIASFFENNKEVLKKFSTLKKKDILIYKKGEILTTSGKYNDNYYEAGTIVDEDIFLESDKDYKELIDSKSLKSYNLLQKKIRKPSLISYIVLLLLSTIIFFILIYYKYELNIALFYTFNFLLIFLPLTFFYSKNIPILFSIAYLYKERIQINNINTFFKVNKVDVIVFDKTSVLTDDNISIVNIDNQSDINLVQLIKTLEQNTYDEIGKFFRKQEYDYLFKIDKSKKLNGGMIINSKEDEYYLGNYDFFKHNKIKVKKNKTLGTAIYVVKNNIFLGSVVIKSSINKEVNKFSYDGDGEDTKEYRKEKNIELKDEKIDLVKNKKVYKILDNVIKSSIDIIDNKKGSLLIEYLNLETIELQKTLESYGDLCNISVITDDNKVILYKNVFSNFEKELLLADNKDGLIYRNELANILLDLNRNSRIVNNREGNFGIIIYNPIYRKCEKYVNTKQLENIKTIREMYNCNMNVEILDIN